MTLRSFVAPALMVLGVVALAVGLRALWLADDDRAPEAVRSGSLAGFDDDTSTTTAPRRDRVEADARPRVKVPVRSARLADVTAQRRAERGARPTGIVLESIGVFAPLVPVGVDPPNGMEIPEDVATVGWYRHGPRPIDRGVTVLAGHVDSARQGRGAFFRLAEVQPGASVLLTDAKARTYRYKVVAVRQYAKDELPPDIWSRRGKQRLALITCGGDFDESARSYRDNVVVYATRVGGSAP